MKIFKAGINGEHWTHIQGSRVNAQLFGIDWRLCPVGQTPHPSNLCTLLEARAFSGNYIHQRLWFYLSK